MVNPIRWYFLRKQKPQRTVYKMLRKQNKRQAKEYRLIAKDNWYIYKRLGDHDFGAEAIQKRYVAMRLASLCRKDLELTWRLAGQPYMQMVWREFGEAKW